MRRPRLGDALLVLSLAGACEHSPTPSESPPPALPSPAIVAASDAAELAAEADPQAEVQPKIELAPQTRAADDPQGPSIEHLDEREHLVHDPAPMETLDQVAARYDLDVERLRKWNDLPEDYRLEKVRKKPKLRLYTKRRSPPRERIEHTVVEGDSWGELARRYGAASTDIRAYNVGAVGRELEPGEVVQVWIDPVIKAEVDRGENEHGLRRGAYSIGTPNEGRLVNAVRLPESDDYTLGYPNSAWGTTRAVSAVIEAMRNFRSQSGYTGVIKIGTMSRQRGGEVGNHKSHQSGRDIDIRLPLKEDVPQKLRPETWRVDWLAAWHLIESFRETGDCLVIFFDYKLQRRIAKAAAAAGVEQSHIDEVLQWPIGSKASRGFVRHEPGHEQHIHVRFACGAYETECRP